MEAPEEDTEFLTLTQPVNGATLRLSETFFDQDVPCTAEPGHLLAVSNHFGWVVAASSQGGFGLFSLPTLRSRVRSASPHDTPKVDPSLHVPTPASVDFVRFAMGEKLVVAGLRDGSIAVWRLKSLVEGQSSPLKTLPALIAGEPLIDLCPNPAPDSPLLAVLGSSAAPLTIFNLETSAVHATFPSDLGATSACWSVKGKQLAVGTASGTIVQLSPEGEQKALVPTPTDLSSNGAFEVRSVEWLENNVFLATYAKPRTKSEDDVEHEDEVYVITKAGQEMSYTKFADPCPPFGMMGRQGRRWVGRFRNWEPFKHLLVMVNAPSADIGVLAQAAAYSPTSPSNGWATLTLPEDTRPTMPTGDKGDDACPLALELDLSASAEDGGDPAVLVYTSRGALVYWAFKNERASGRYEGMIKSRDVLTQENEDAPPAGPAAGQAEAKPSPATAPVSKPTAFGAFAAPSAFGTASTPPAFRSSAAPSKLPVSAFGSTAFGASTTSSTPTFGSTSGFGTAPALGSGFSAFGSSAAPKSPFGTPAVSSATTTAPAAGSAFAAVPSTGGFSAFGSVAPNTTSGGGGGGFGAAAASTAPKASPFGSGSAFGSAPAFGGGATTAPSSGGFAAFGAAKPAAGGFGAFGGGGGGSAAAVPGKSVFGAGATASALGSGGIVAASPSSSSTTTTTVPKFSFAPTATRGAKGSDDEDDEEGMGDDDDDSAKPRVDEPPDLEPTKTGLDFGQSVREAEKAGPPKRDTASAPAPGTESLSGGFGSLGFGAKSPAATPSSQGLGTSVFGAAAAVTSTAATPGFAAPAKTPAFGFGAATTAPTSSPFGGSPFSFGQQPKQVEKSASQEIDKPATSAFGISAGGGFAGFAAKKDGGDEQPKPTFSFAPKTPETTAKPSAPAASVSKADEPKTNETPSTPAKDDASTSPAPAPAPPRPAFSFASTPAKSPAATEEKKPSGSAFGFGGTAGGFGAFAAPKSTPAAKDDEQKISATPSSPVTAEGDSTKESPREEDEDEAEQDDDNSEEESNEDSDDSGAESDGTDAPKSPTPEPAAPTKPAFSFAPSGSSAAFPKSTGAGGFGAFAGGSSTGFGFGAAAPAKSPSTGTGFGFGVAATPSPSASSTGFSFAPKTPPPAAAATDAKVESKPAFSFAPAAKPATESSAPETKPTFSFAPKAPAETTPAATSAPVSIPAASSPKAEKPKDTTKSLFGFASSPPEEKLRSSGDGSLLSRLGAKEPSSEDEEDQEEDAEEEDEGATGEEDEEAEDEEGASGDELEESEGDDETAPAVAPSGQPSLLSRLSPAPPSPTPSPTPSQPTAVKEPEAAKAPEPVKAPSFSFAPPPADAPKPPSFSFAPASSAQQTAPSLTPATPPVPSPVTSKSPGGFLNFTSTAPRSSSPLSAPPLAVPSLSATSTKVTPAPAPTAGSFGTPASKPSFSFGAPAAALSPSPAIDVAGAPKAGPPPALPVPSATTKSLAPTPAPVSTPPAPAPAAKPVEPATPPALSVASAPVPKLGSQLIAAGGAKPPGVTEQGMAGEFLKAYLGVQQDFELLRKNSAIIRDFVAGLERPCHPPLTKDSRPQLDAQHWSFGDVDKLKQLTREAQPGVEALHAAAVAQKRRITELQSQILKAETKREEASRFLRARSDPAFAKLVRVRQLGPEQTENQRKIRHQVEAVRAKIEQLEEHLLSLKKQLAKEKLGQSTLQAPSLDSIQRAMRNITVAATEKGLELDEIAARLHRMQVGERGNKPMTPRKTSFAMSPLKAVLDQSSILRQSASPSPRSSAPVNGQDASEAAAAALGAERVAGNLKKALLSLRGSAPLVNRTACGSQMAQLSRPSAEIQLAFSQGPITGDRLPRPRHFSPPRAPVELPLKSGSLSKAGPVLPASPASPASPATPSTAGPKPPFSFALGGSKPESVAASLGSAAVAPPPAFPSLNLKAAPSFSFATPVASSPPSSSSATSGSRGLRTSSRTHAGAAQLKSNGTPPSSASSSFDWGPLPASLATTTPAKSASAPANFISLSSTPAASPAPSKLPSSLGTSGLPASIPHKAPISFGTTSSATPVKPPAPSSSFGFGSTTPAATAASAPSFSFGTSTPTAPPASKAPALAGSFGFGNSSSTTPSKPAPSFSFGASSTPTAPPSAAKAPTGFSFGAPGIASATPKPAFSFAGPAPPATSKPAEAAQEDSDGSDSDSAAEEEQPEEHEEEEEEWEGDEFGDEEYGDNDEEEEEGLDAISEHTDEE